MTARPNIKYEVMLEGQFDIAPDVPHPQPSQQSLHGFSALFSVTCNEDLVPISCTMRKNNRRSLELPGTLIRIKFVSKEARGLPKRA